MEQYFATIFEDVRHESSLVLLLRLVERSNLLTLVALGLLEKQFSNYFNCLINEYISTFEK